MRKVRLRLKGTKVVHFQAAATSPKSLLCTQNENFSFSKGFWRCFLYTVVPAPKAAHSAGSAQCTHKFTVTATQLEVVSQGPAAHSTAWESQPSVGGKQAGNLLLASGIFFSGCLAEPVLRLLTSINMQVFTERTFYYIPPSILGACRE
ncbi:hypothetical protein HPB48_015695 [Haemaphysalis longicornis]|uniref:Uncharacterized protein n=1 Tax=Haemaphysalis longicornis TaxID=44386 RepID=A0A9J6GX97_HAELO|nr:hypothetical protein HPB48_015695 [Haemaphysalis longicornis]